MMKGVSFVLRRWKAPRVVVVARKSCSPIGRSASLLWGARKSLVAMWNLLLAACWRQRRLEAWFLMRAITSLLPKSFLCDFLNNWCDEAFYMWRTGLLALCGGVRGVRREAFRVISCWGFPAHIKCKENCTHRVFQPACELVYLWARCIFNFKHSA